MQADGSGSGSGNGSGVGSKRDAQPIILQQMDKALLKAFEKSLTPFRSVHAHFPVFGSSSAAAAAANTKESDTALRSKIDAHFQTTMKWVAANTLAEMRTILSEPQTVSAAITGSGGSSSGSGSSMDVDSGDGSAGGDDSADTENATLSTPNKKRGGKKSSKSKSKSPAAKASAAGSAGSATAAVNATSQVTLNGQLSRMARLTALQPKLSDNTYMPALESSAMIEQRMRDAAAQTKIAQREALQQQLRQLQGENAALSQKLIAKRHSIQQIQSEISKQMQHLAHAMDACNTWKPPASQH